MKTLYFINGNNYRQIHYDPDNKEYRINWGKRHNGKPTEYVNHMVSNGWKQTDLAGYINVKYNSGVSEETLEMYRERKRERERR